MSYSGYSNGQSYYKLRDNDDNLSTELYEEKYSQYDGRYYYQSGSKIYANGREGLVAASFKTGADGKPHLFYQPQNIIKTIHTKKVKVLKNSGAIASVQLGKTKQSFKNTNKAYSSSSSATYKQLLSGSKGKLTVKMANKNYSITSIIVLTYDKDGNMLCQKVGNKKTVTYGTGKGSSSYQSPYNSNYNYSYNPLYKSTTVYVGYKDKFTGAFTKFDVVPAENGKSQIKTTYRYSGDKENSVYTGGAAGPCWDSFVFYKK